MKQKYRKLYASGIFSQNILSMTFDASGGE